MKAAIIGPPQSGKSTLLGAATGIAPDPVAMPQVQQSVVKVPDDRLDALAKMYNPKKITEATIEFADVPGLALSEPKGQEDLKRYLPDIRQCVLLVAVLRNFDNPSVPAYKNRVDPDADLQELRDELTLADLATIETRIERIEKSLKKPTKTHEQEKRELAILQAGRDALEDQTPLSEAITNEEDLKALSSFGFLTLKPILAVYNVGEDKAASDDPPPPGTVGAVSVCASAELEIAQLDPDDRPDFMAEYGLTEPGKNRLVRKCYESLGLISFLTAGDPEVRAWTVRKGSDAVEAASQIHSDIARGFIRAETVAYSDLMELGDMKAAKSAGKVRQEGKTYVVADGDVIHFKFNV